LGGDHFRGVDLGLRVGSLLRAGGSEDQWIFGETQFHRWERQRRCLVGVALTDVAVRLLLEPMTRGKLQFAETKIMMTAIGRIGCFTGNLLAIRAERPEASRKTC
jgi:hypothetical protein